MMKPIDLVLSKLQDVKERGDQQWQARCPAHDDHKPSLSISTGEDERVLLKCQAGCAFNDIVTAMGLRPADLFNKKRKRGKFVKTYDYTDETGELLYQAVRKEPKAFLQRRPDGNDDGWIWNLNGVDRVLYRLPELLQSDPWDCVFICEGEKSTDAVASLGLVATTNAMGAGKWHRGGENYTEPLRGRNVCILSDNDEAGKKHARQIAESLHGIASPLRVLELPGLEHKQDPFDWCANGGDKTQLLALTENAPEFQPVINDAVSADSLAPDPDPLPDCPPLPDDAQLDPILGNGAGWWLYDYVSHAEAISPMTPTAFHLSAGLWLASVAIARRLVLRMAFGDVFPNLFVAWIAPTTLYRKSTALDVARGVARRVIPHLLCAQDTTPEAFLSDLAGREPAHFDQFSVTDLAEWTAGRNFAAQRGWVLDEMSGMLAASGRDYNAGLTEALLRFYDCDPRYTRSTRGQGRVTVRNSYLAMIGASTPAAMSTHLNSDRLWAMGFWPRFAILTPNGKLDWRRAQDRAEPAEVVGGLRRLYEALPEATYPNPPDALTVTLGEGVYTAWERYNKSLSYDLLLDDDLDHKLHGTYGRLPVMALKVATILAALDWSEPPDGPKSNSPMIELPHLARAMEVCEDWRASAHRVIEQAREQEFDRLRVRILRQIGRFMPNGATLRDLYRALKKEPIEIESALLELVKLGEVEAVEVNPGKKGGRRTTRYRLVSE